jgi:hypothetical protein
MARISGPTDPVVPLIGLYDLALAVPMDLTEGGFLQVVPGTNPLAQAIPSIYVPAGCMVAIIPPQVAVHIRAGIVKAQQTHTLAEKPPVQ